MHLLRRGGVAALWWVASLARAHGQFPLPLSMFPDGPDTRGVAVATFGLLLPRPEAPGYTWVCEEVAGGSTTSAVVWARTSVGTVVAGGRLGGFRLTANLCGVMRPLGILPSERVRAVATHRSAPVVALTVGTGEVRLSLDDGMTFATTALAKTSAIPGTVLVDGDPAHPRILVLWRLLSDGHAELQISDDGGQTSRSVVIPDPNAGVWELVAVDPAHADQVYVRENGDSVDRLLRVSLADGSATVLREEADDLALGVSADGMVVATGGLLSVLRISEDAGATFVDRATVRQVRGVAFGENHRIFMAADNWHDGFAFGVSDDLGLTWRGLGRFADIAGVHTCPDVGPGCAEGADACVTGVGNDVAAQCGPYWPALVELFGIRGDGGVTDPPDAGITAPPAPPVGCGHCAQTDASWLVLLVVAGWRRRRRAALSAGGVGTGGTGSARAR